MKLLDLPGSRQCFLLIYKRMKKAFFIIKIFRTIVFIFMVIHNVSADMSSGLLQVFLELGNLRGT